MRVIGAALLLALSQGPARAAESRAESAATVGADPRALIGPDAFFSPVLPASGRYVLVDAAQARLFMVEDGRVADSMRVVVGKPSSSTPVVRSELRGATLNPYWNVPTDLGQTLIAPRVLKHGTAYLARHRYIVVTSFDADATEIAADDVDWHAVAEGRQRVFVRQLPGGANAMGRIKFGFAGTDGIFLHDTPDKTLFEASDRRQSNGCVRLEDADRLARWLFGTAPEAPSDRPEQRVAMPAPVPILITYSRPALELASR